jgi:hypothetical protein
MRSFLRLLDILYRVYSMHLSCVVWGVITAVLACSIAYSAGWDEAFDQDVGFRCFYIGVAILGPVLFLCTYDGITLHALIASGLHPLLMTMLVYLGVCAFAAGAIVIFRSITIKLV